MTDRPNQNSEKNAKGFSGKQVMGITLGAVIAAVVVTIAVYFFIFPPPFTPVELSEREQQVLEEKIEIIDAASGFSLQDLFGGARKDEISPDGALKPEPYTEKGANREITISERELNGLLANNTDLARKLAIDLADDLISAKLLVPVDPDFPVLGNKTIRIHAGLVLAYREGRPVVKVKGVSLMGIPLPNAWLGGIKNVDLVEEFSGDRSRRFWKGFSEGVDTIAVKEGKLFIRLKE